MNREEKDALSECRSRSDAELAREVALGLDDAGQYDESEEYADPADGGPFATDIRPAYPQAAAPYSPTQNPYYGQPAQSPYQANPYGTSPYGTNPYGASPYGTAPTTFAATDANQALVNQILTTRMRGQRQWSAKLLHHLLKAARHVILRAYKTANQPMPADHGRAESRWRVRWFASQNGITLPANVSLAGARMELQSCGMSREEKDALSESRSRSGAELAREVLAGLRNLGAWQPQRDTSHVPTMTRKKYNSLTPEQRDRANYRRAHGQLRIV